MPYARPFVCYRCCKPCVATKTLEELREDARKMFGEYPAEKDVEICEDCGTKVLEWYAAQQPVQ